MNENLLNGREIFYENTKEAMKEMLLDKKAKESTLHDLYLNDNNTYEDYSPALPNNDEGDNGSFDVRRIAIQESTHFSPAFYDSMIMYANIRKMNGIDKKDSTTMRLKDLANDVLSNPKIDYENYKTRLGSHFNQDKRYWSETSISLEKMKEVVEKLEIKTSPILSIKLPDWFPDNIKKEYVSRHEHFTIPIPSYKGLSIMETCNTRCDYCYDTGFFDIESGNKNEVRYIYDYDDTSLYSQITNDISFLKNNVHINLKRNQYVYLLYNGFIYEIDYFGIKYYNKCGELKFKHDSNPFISSILRGLHGYGFDDKYVVMTFEQYGMLDRKDKYNLFPEPEEFKLDSLSNFIKKVNDELSCIYYIENIYLYVDNYGNDYFELAPIEVILDSIACLYKPRLMKKPASTGGYRFKSYQEIAQEFIDMGKRKSSVAIIESKQKKPIYSKRRG